MVNLTLESLGSFLDAVACLTGYDAHIVPFLAPWGKGKHGFGLFGSPQDHHLIRGIPY